MTDGFLHKEIESRQPVERNTVDKEKTKAWKYLCY
jgi:hypothetical protein